MKDTELKAARDRDLFLCYQKALRENDFHNQKEAIEYVCRNPAPRFYISHKTCSLLLGRLFAGKPIGKLHPLSMERLRDLEKMYIEAINGAFKNSGLFRQQICEFLVEMPAPQFYITYKYANRIICREIARHNKEEIRKLVR